MVQKKFVFNYLLLYEDNITMSVRAFALIMPSSNDVFL